MKPEISGYTIIAEIHRSPIAVIYRAKQDALDRTVIVKILQTNLQLDQEITRRFQREAKAIARLKHPNIVQIYDYGESNGVPYFIMEYVEGQDLQGLIKREKQIGFERTEKIVRQLLQALHYSHEKGVLHRDIKPANLLITENDFVKLTDFGLAVFQQAPEITEHGQVVGTPAYMSPEQAKGEHVDEKSDLFSLGVTLYEMLTGEKLFGGKTITESLHKLLQQPVNLEKIKKIKPPEDLLAFCQRLLKKDVNDRFSSAKQALSFLENKEESQKRELILTTNQKKRFKKVLIPLVVIVTFLLIVIYFEKFKQPGEKEKITLTENSKDSFVTNEDSLQEKLFKPPIEQNEIPINLKNKESNLADTRKIVVNSEQRVQTKENLPDQKDSVQNQTKQTGFLAVQCLPWANLWIDDEPYGETTTNHIIELSSGKHFLSLNNPHFAAFVDTFQIEPGDTQKVFINLEQQFGELQLNVLPWAKVYIDDKFLDDSPIWEPIRLKSGPHKIRLENPAFSNWEQEVFIRVGEKKTLEVTLK